MRKERVKSIEDMLQELLAKHALLLDAFHKLREDTFGVKSEMKSNYVAIKAMFDEVCAGPKA